MKSKTSVITPPTFDDIFDLFNGSWSISREVINYEEGQFSATAKGTAAFYRQSSTTSLLHENVTVDWMSGLTSLATKSYLFEQNNNSLLQYRFDNPVNLQKTKQLDQAALSEKILMHILLFHKTKSTLSSDSLHCCGTDKYKLSFKIISQDKFLMNYYIHGPFKNSSINTIYTRTTRGEADYGCLK